MDWGTELWDQFESIDKYLQHGFDFGEKYSKFIKERCAIEQEYATKLRKLVKSYQPKKKDEERSMFSTHKAFQTQLSELNDIAGQHETVAENMMSNIFKESQIFFNEQKIEKKRMYQEGKSLQIALDKCEQNLEHTKKKFEKEWKDCERLQANFEKLDSDTNVTKADVEKAKHAWFAKKDVVEHCKQDYGAALETFNVDQHSHYSTRMPQVFQGYHAADERRILKIRDLMVEYAKIDKKVKPIIQKCLDGMETAGNAVDPKLDSSLVVEKLKSGFLIPGNKEFEDYRRVVSSPTFEEGVESSPRNSMNFTRGQNRKGFGWIFGPKKIKRSSTMDDVVNKDESTSQKRSLKAKTLKLDQNLRHSVTANKKKIISMFKSSKENFPSAADYSHLPPEQRKKKLQRHIDDLSKEIAKQQDEKKAIVKMHGIYTANPALGDPTSLDAGQKAVDAKIDKLMTELQQYENWYTEAFGSLQSSPARNSAHYTTPVKVEPLAIQPQTQNKYVSIYNIIPSRSLQRDQSFGDEFDELDDFPEPIGTCTALYDYEATSEGALSITCGQVFSLLEADNGDGWTRVMLGNSDGYVPSSYIEV
uniref:F-BAR domain-containing protein n=1 Tax=Ciona savignyi TaxID=51511 RepID=H2Y7I7_CIOSA